MRKFFKRFQLRSIVRYIPKGFRPMIKSVVYWPLDTFDLLTGRRDAFTPPRRLSGTGYGTFKKIGEEFFRYFKGLGELKPSEKVLDIGCSFGRLAVPLTKYFNENGRYEGFDIVASDINWAQKKISSKYSNFHFQLADIYNKEYNPKGRYQPANYRFPYQDNYFDFVFLSSIFTHMLPDDMAHYFSEISRVLKKGGRCLITFLLLNEESLKLIEEKKPPLNFKYVFKEYRFVDENVPEVAVAYNEQFINHLYEKFGFKVKGPIYYGSWCRREKSLSHQDIIIASKI